MMIQEVLGAVVEERKLSNIPSSLLVPSSPTNTSISSSFPSQSAASSPSSASTSETLRCPRCDSSNTKFCYYNNYNLTQPRHFCKTCRRYWTKGGALRNVPIGGGCRKTKAAATVIGGSKSTRPMAADVFVGHMDRMDYGGAHGHCSGLQDHELLPSNPLLWTGRSNPHSLHLLALLRACQAQQNHNPNLFDYCVKEEGAMAGEPMSMDPMANLYSSSNNNNNSLLCRNESSELQYQQRHQDPFLADAPTSSGIQELYQRLRAPANCGSSDNQLLHMMISNGNHVSVGSSSAATATMATNATTTAAGTSIMGPMPLLSGGDQFGYWNTGLTSWADLPTANGAFL